MKKVIVSGKVCLCLFATKDIAPNEELRYDYGLKDLPWRVKSGDGSDNMNKNWKNSTTRKDGAVISQDCEEVVCAKEDSCKGGMVTSQDCEEVACGKEDNSKGDVRDNINKNWKNSTTCKDGVLTSQDCEEVVCGKEDSSKGDVRDNINKNWKNSTTCKDWAVMSQDCEEVVCAKEDSCKGDRSGNINENWKNSTTRKDGVVTSQDCEEVVCGKEDSSQGDLRCNINKNWKNSTTCKGLAIPLVSLCGQRTEKVPVPSNTEFVPETCSSEENDTELDTPGYAWKRCHDSTASEESEEFSVTRKKKPCSKALFSESESDSDGERHADVEICGIGKVACDSSSKGKFQRGQLATKTSRNSKGYAWKRCHDSTASEESEEFSVTRKKKPCSKAVFSESESDSDGERHADVEICGIGKVACDSSSKGKFQRGKVATKTSRNSKGYAWKRCHDSTASEESEEFSVTRKKKPCSKALFSECESDSDGERHADVEICGIGKVACDSSSKGKFQRGKLTTKTSRDSKVVITCVKKREDNARVYDKRQACFYCEKLYAKISRHYEHNHKDESEVVNAFAHPRGSKERKKAIEKLRLQGNFHHNLRVLESKSGQLIVIRRPGEGEECSLDDFLPCPHCLGFMKKKDLWRHVKGCNFRSGDDDTADDKKYQKLQSKSKLLILPSICPGKSSLFQDVVASMKSDHITLVARNDAVISALGTMMVEKVGSKRCHDISQNMRNLARLLISLREVVNNENAQLSQFLRPDKFDVLVQCVMQISKFEVKRAEKEVGTPSLALHIGYSLKKCVGIVRGKALREKDKGLLEDVEHFEKLMEAEWNFRISHHSITTLSDRKHNQPELLPVTNDLKKLKEFITSKIIALTSELQGTNRPLLQTWRDLSEMVLNRLILFNKRRGGETAKLHLDTYINRPDWSRNTNQDVVASLNGIEQQLLHRLDMVEIKGKRGRKVPLLLTKEVKEAIDVLVKKRTEVGINQKNPYLFAATASGSLGHLRPWECMRKVVTSDELKLEKPEAVTSTRLRKYVAAVSQILDLQENELDWLARHLGHDISVHREYYRLHESTIELAKVGKILTTVDEGKTRLWAGKSLDDIDLDKDIDPISHDHQVSRDSGSEECIVTDAAKHTPHQQVSRQQQSVSSRKLQGTPAPKQNAMTEKTKKATGKENVGTLASIAVLICILLCECNAEAPHLARWLSSRLFCEDRNLVEKLLVFVLCIQYGKQN
ncbi:uncharacterized protein [Montipora capricornis]|uniref:uncharacterized protein n=1 Tax=Montipora capricornis TaxID=246305 RepID=UPI0035F19414